MKRSSNTQSSSSPKKSQTNKCIRKIDQFTSKSLKHHFIRSKSKFVIDQIEKCANPQAEFRSCVQKAVEDAIQDAQNTLGGANKVGVIISSELLDHGDIILPITPITSNVVDAVFNQFCKVEQSKAKYVNLYGAPFVVTVTVLNTDGLPRRRTTKGSAPPILSSQSHIFKINNNDNYCLFYGLELMRYYSLYKRGIITEKRWRWINNNQTTVLQQKALQLLREAGVPTTEPEYDAEIYIHQVQGLWSTKYPGEYKIFIFNDYQTRPITKSDVTDYQFPILLYHHDKHFDGIKTISKFFNKRYYCLSCESFYERKSSHSMNCSSLCHGCREVGVDYPCEAQQGYFKKCLHCKNNFYNKDCYERHLHKDLCTKFQRCGDCGVIYNVKVHGNVGHKCGEKFCKLCKQFHIKEEDGENPCKSCFIQPLKQQRIKPYRIIAYDFEATQDKKVGNRFEHEVNFAAATIICTECINNGEWKNSLRGKKCQICGPHRTITFSPFDYTGTTVDQKIITQNPLRDFVGWLLFEHTKKYSTVAFAHFGGRYDMTMIIKEVLAQGIHNPDIIKQGNRLYELKIKDNEHCPLTILHDSYNLMPIKLSGLIKSFGLKIQDKQHFPHMFNKETNYDNVLPHLPQRQDYCPNQMKKADLQSFDNWYNNNLHQPFDLKEKLPEYCCNDVKILTHALVELRREFKQLTQRNGKHGGIDILWQAMTIASACVKNYALNHLKPNSLAIVPEKGYTPQQNQSALAIKYLDWYSHINNVNIQTAHSRYGEYVFKREGQVYQVDGYIKGINGRRDKIIEVNGCLWHGCEECFEEMDEETRMPNGKTLGQLKEREVRKHDILSRYVDLEVVWEHEINEQLKKDTAMREFFDNWKDRSPIKIRDAFHGGRTGPMKLLHTTKPGQKISYKDFTSLYPWTNFSTDYPLGHPKIISFPVNEQTVNWRSPSDNPYKGLLKVLLLPPNNSIKVTVMPIKFDERLLFPLCQKCAKHITAKYPNGLKDNEYSCPHFNPNDRAFVSTCTHLELNAALEAGYTARKLFHVLQYDQWSNNVFKSYVSEMMALKIHATGFPSWCESEEQKREYIEECWMKFAIKLDKEKMKSEPGKRYIAKLCLNSLWGRFSMRNLLSKAIIDNDESIIHQYTEDKKIELIDLEMMDEDNDVFMLTYKPKEEFVDENKYSNVVISLFTTSMARLYLYEALKKVDDTPGCEILYFDTDSIIYVHPEDNDPLPTGKGHLGELTDEKPDHNILEFISAGCKNYGLKLQRKDNGEICFDLKIRGFTLDEQTVQKIHYDTVKDQILRYGSDDPADPIIVTYPHFIRPNLIQGKVFTHSLTKHYQPIFTKGHPSEMKVDELFIIVMRSLVSECWIGDRRKTLQSVVGQVIEQEAEIKSSVKPLKENDLEKSERKPTHTISNLLDHQRSFWKLARPKFAVINFLCPGCRRINYKHKDQFKLMGEDEFHFTQELRRFLKLRKEIEDKPVKVELTDGSLMVFNPKQREKNRKIPTQIVHEDGLDETGSIPTLEDPYATAEESDAEPTTSTPKTRPLIRPMRVGTNEIFQVYDIKKARPHRYGIKDDNEESFDTRFYAEDLAKTRKDAETTYRIEKVLKTRIRTEEYERTSYEQNKDYVEPFFDNYPTDYWEHIHKKYEGLQDDYKKIRELREQQQFLTDEQKKQSIQEEIDQLRRLIDYRKKRFAALEYEAKKRDALQQPTALALTHGEILKERIGKIEGTTTADREETKTHGKSLVELIEQVQKERSAADTAYLDAELSYSKNVKESDLQASGYYVDSENQDGTDSTQQALVANNDPSNKEGTHWIAMFIVDDKTVYYFDSFGRIPNRSKNLCDRLNHPDEIQKVERFLKGKTMQTTYSNHLGKQKEFIFGGITKESGRKKMAYNGFKNVTVDQHFYVRHRICLRYPNNPCVIEKSMNGNEKFYPLELSCPSDQQLVLSIVTSGLSNDHQRALKWTLRALEWHTRALKWHTRGRSGGMVSLPFPKGDDS
ncbi:hypothetical protein niasHT_028974 [Heterodera trifolii]|uniref:DNA-directed DNA polymerase n=1 Tax=Heterodera trifolii TaxID=157864 RepID=A0ABD2JB04_9BILA